MLEINKTEEYSVFTYKGRAMIGTGKTVEEALENYLKNLNNTLNELEDIILKLEECKVEAEEKIKQLKINN